ncbi:MAG: O-antigen ligase family protein [Opitutales bacterium]
MATPKRTLRERKKAVPPTDARGATAIAIWEWLEATALGLTFLFAPLALSTAGNAHDGVLVLKETLFRIGVSLVVASALTRFAWQGMPVPRFPWLGWVLLALGGWSLLTLSWAHTSYFGLQQWPKYASAGALFLVAACGLLPRRTLGFAALGLVFAATVNVVLALTQHFLGLTAIPQGSSPAGLFGGRNNLAQFLGAVLPLAAILAAYMRSWRLRGSLLALCAGICLLQVVIFARSVWLGFMLGLLLVGLADRSWRHLPKFKDLLGKRQIIIGAGALGGLFVLMLLPVSEGRSSLAIMQSKVTDAVEAYERFSSGGRASAGSASVNYRILMFNNSRAALADHGLVGTGLGTWAAVYHGYSQARYPDTTVTSDSIPFYAHNFYLEKALELGAPGALLIAVLFGGLLGIGIQRLWRGQPSSLEQGALAAALFSAVVIMVSSSLSMPLNYSVGPFVLALAGGWICAPAGKARKAHVEPMGRAEKLAVTPKFRWVLASIVALLALMNIGDAHARWRAFLLFGKGDEAMRAGETEQALYFMRQVLELEPRHYRANTRAAILLHEIDPEQSYAHLETVRGIYPDIPANLGLLAVHETRSANPEAAMAHWKHLLSVAPNDVKGLRGAMRTAYELGRLQEAFSYARRLISLEPDNPVNQRAHADLAEALRTEQAQAAADDSASPARAGQGEERTAPP